MLSRTINPKTAYCAAKRKMKGAHDSAHPFTAKTCMGGETVRLPVPSTNSYLKINSLRPRTSVMTSLF